MEEARPSNQGANTVEAKAEDEDWFVAIMSKDPICVTEGSKGIGTWHTTVSEGCSIEVWYTTKVSCLQTTGSSSRYPEGILEVFIQCIEQAVGEPLMWCLSFSNCIHMNNHIVAVPRGRTR